MKSVFFLLSLSLLGTSLMKTGADAQKKPAQTEGPQPFRLFNPDTMAKPTAGYSQVAEVSGGKMIYVAGQVSMDASGNLVGKDDFRAQVDQAFKN
ncbi:MAG TPA: Rid family hydrolase, partial [Candidatus Angelobacter sp.]|nr:Rid family hydrolase [Candidatus Angelobacter sp.]